MEKHTRGTKTETYKLIQNTSPHNSSQAVTGDYSAAKHIQLEEKWIKERQKEQCIVLSNHCYFAEAICRCLTTSNLAPARTYREVYKRMKLTQACKYILWFLFILLSLPCSCLQPMITKESNDRCLLNFCIEALCGPL